MGRIAITGTSSFLGGALLRRLASERGPDSVVSMDIASPPATLHGVRRRLLDFTEPASDQRLVEAFQEERVTALLHLAFFTSPRRDTTYAHELESIGTMNVLGAAAAAGLEHVVMRSFTAVYGARGQNPNFVTEEARLQPNPALSWARDKLEAEQHAASFAKRYPALKVTVLRLAPLFGPGRAHVLHPCLRPPRGAPCSWATTPSSSSCIPRTPSRRSAPRSRARRAGPSTWCPGAA